MFRTIVVGVSTFVFSSVVATSLAYLFIWKNTADDGDDGRKSRKKQQAKSMANKVPGLHNLGSTCFANALLQGLASCPTFVNWLTKLPLIDAEQSKFEFLFELKRMLLALNDPESNAETAERIICALLKHRWLINVHTEQDLYELLNVFVTTWDEELATLSKISQPLSLLQINAIENVECASNVNQLLAAVSQSITTDNMLRPPSTGIIGTQFQCRTCAHKHVRHDKFCALSLAIPKTSALPYITLECCLRKYLSSEVIKDAACDKCSKTDTSIRCDLIKKQGISKLPSCLILRIERVGCLFNGSSFKHNDYIQFPEILDLEPFCFYRSNEQIYARSNSFPAAVVLGGKVEIPPSNPLANLTAFHNGNIGLKQSALISGGSHILNASNYARTIRHKYRLSAVIVHCGSPETGHFVTYRRGIDTNSHNWFFISDSIVRKATFAEVLNCEAYMLFYESIHSSSHFDQNNLTPQIGN